jgi:hypothetical protein
MQGLCFLMFMTSLHRPNLRKDDDGDDETIRIVSNLQRIDSYL